METPKHKFVLDKSPIKVKMKFKDLPKIEFKNQYDKVIKVEKLGRGRNSAMTMSDGKSLLASFYILNYAHPVDMVNLPNFVYWVLDWIHDIYRMNQSNYEGDMVDPVAGFYDVDTMYWINNQMLPYQFPIEYLGDHLKHPRNYIRDEEKLSVIRKYFRDTSKAQFFEDYKTKFTRLAEATLFGTAFEFEDNKNRTCAEILFKQLEMGSYQSARELLNNSNLDIIFDEEQLIILRRTINFHFASVLAD